MMLLCGTSALVLSQSLEDNRRAAEIFEEKAYTLDAREAALAQLKESARVFLNANDTIEAAKLLNRIGRLQLILNTPLAAIESHEQALGLLKQTAAEKPGIDSVTVDNLNGLAEAYARIDKDGEAQTAQQQALELSRRVSYRSGEAEALLILSEQQNYTDHILAVQTAQQALSIWNELNDKRGMAGAYSQIGRDYLAQNLLSEATQNYETAQQLWRELDNPSEQAEALVGLGFIEYRKGDFERAISYHTEAQKLIDDRAEPTRAGQIAVGIGESLTESGLLEEALLHYERALNYYSQIGKPGYVAFVVWVTGCTHYLLGNYSEAIVRFEQVLSQQKGEGLLAAQCHEYLGRVYLAKHDTALALQHLQLALPTYLQAHNPRETAQVIAFMGRAYQQQGEAARARQYYRRALDSFTQLDDRPNEAVVLYALGQLELQEKNYDDAETLLRRSIDLTEDLRRMSSSQDLTAAFSATVHERYESYIECLMRKHQTQPNQALDVRAFEASELARGRSLAEVLRATETNLLPGLDPQLAEQEKALRQSLRVKEDYKVKLLSGSYKKEELDALQSELAGLNAQYKQVTESIRARYPSYADMSRPVSWSLGQIQQQVVTDTDTVLLEYSLGAEQSYAWLVTNNGISSYQLPAGSQINEAAKKLHRILTTGRSVNESELNRATEELSQMVLLPVAAGLNKRRVIVVADGALNYIPFQMLPTSLEWKEPLIASSEVISAPSASILGQLREETTRRKTPTKVLAAFGDPVFASNYAERREPSTGEYIASAQPPADQNWQHALRDIVAAGDSFEPAAVEQLFYSKRELANLREVAGPESFVATGFDATREKLAAADLTGYAILHFATHGIIDPKQPEKSGLLLSLVDRNGRSQNGFVGLQDIYNLHAPVDLVVLSACRTGLGKDVRGEGLIGLTRGFMYAGASSVIASLWKVDDEATAELMKRFYSNLLQKGMTPAAALRAAQNSIRQEPQWRSPYFWAAFTLQGEYRQVIKPVRSGFTASTPRVVIALSVLLLGILAGWYWRVRRNAISVNPQ